MNEIDIIICKLLIGNYFLLWFWKKKKKHLLGKFFSLFHTGDRLELFFTDFVSFFWQGSFLLRHVSHTGQRMLSKCRQPSPKVST